MKAVRNLTGRLNLIIGLVIGAVMTGSGNYELPLIVAGVLLLFTLVAFFCSLGQAER